MLLKVDVRRQLSERLRKNWSAQHPRDPSRPGDAVDESLTSLAWLQNLNIMKIRTPAPHRIPASVPTTVLEVCALSKPAPISAPTAEQFRAPTFAVSTPTAQRIQTVSVLPQTATVFPATPLSSNNKVLLVKRRSIPSIEQVTMQPTLSQNLTQIPDQKCKLIHLPDWTKTSELIVHNSPSTSTFVDLPQVSANETCRTTRPVRASKDSKEDTDYKTNAKVKPHHSYATLIYMAMNASPGRRSTLTDIYSWITDNFAYYATADPNWQNSVRHNLSYNKCFQKFFHGSDDSGKSGYWTINPNFEHLVDSNKGLLKRQPPTDFYCAPPQTKRPRTGSLDKTKVLKSFNTATGTTEYSDTVVDGRVSDWASVDPFLDAFDGKIRPFLNADINASSFGSQKYTHDQPDDCANVFKHDLPFDNDLLFDFDEFLQSSTNIADLEAVSESDPLDLTVYGVAVQAPNLWHDPSPYLNPLSPPGIDTESYLEQGMLEQDGFDHPWTDEEFLHSPYIDFVDIMN